MTEDVDVVATLTNLATYLRRLSKAVTLQNDRRGLKVLVKHVENVIDRYVAYRNESPVVLYIIGSDVRELLDIAEAMRVTGPEKRISHD
jgi:hypothetical protein